MRLCPSSGYTVHVCGWYVEGLLYASPSWGSTVCVPRYVMTLMCQLCLEEWTENWWSAMTHRHETSSGLPVNIHTQSWHFYLEHIYRLPIYSVVYDIVMKPAGLTKLSPCIGCVCSICTHVKWSVRSCSTACLFNSPIRQIRLVCILISQKALRKNKWITMRVKQSWKLSTFRRNRMPLSNNHTHVHMVNSHRVQIWPAECVYLNF